MPPALRTFPTTSTWLPRVCCKLNRRFLLPKCMPDDFTCFSVMIPREEEESTLRRRGSCSLWEGKPLDCGNSHLMVPPYAHESPHVHLC
jgi:hypothetical protein